MQHTIWEYEDFIVREIIEAHRYTMYIQSVEELANASFYIFEMTLLSQLKNFSLLFVCSLT